MASRGRLEAILEAKSAILEAKKANGKIVCYLLAGVGGMAGRPWLRQEHSEYSWSTWFFTRRASLADAAHLVAPPFHGPFVFLSTFSFFPRRTRRLRWRRRRLGRGGFVGGATA